MREQEDRIYLRCQQCNKQVEHNRRKFCSRKCYHIYHSRKSYLLNKDEVIKRSKEYHKRPKYIEYVKNQRKTQEYKNYMKEYHTGWAKTIEGRKSLREAKRRYDKTEKGKEKSKEYRKSENWKNYIKNYNNNPINQKRLKEWKEKWTNSKEGKEILRKADKKFLKSEKGRISNRLKCSKRRSNKRQLVERFSREEWMNKLKESEGFCFNCKKQIGVNNLTLDHIIPISSGLKREYFIEDVQPLCKSCNSSKRDKVL